MTSLRTFFSLVFALALGACQGSGGISPETGQLAGAAGGAAVGATVGDGGIIAPAVGAIGGAVVGEELAEDDPVFQ